MLVAAVPGPPHDSPDISSSQFTRARAMCAEACSLDGMSALSCMDRRVASAQVSNLLGSVSLDDEMVNEHVLPKLKKEDIMLDFVHVDEHSGAGANGNALTTSDDALSLIDQVRATYGSEAAANSCRR